MRVFYGPGNIDPPYYGFENDYGKEIFSRDDFTRLRDLCTNMKGKFLLSINDVPEIRKLFAQFHINTVQTLYTTNAPQQRTVRELVITNYPLQEVNGCIYTANHAESNSIAA